MVPETQQADVCIICALEEEANAVEQVICERCQVTFVASVTHDSHLSYRSTTITNNKGELLTLALLCQTRPGPASAAFDVGTLLQIFQPCFVGMSGICAGDKRHVQLGDLAVAEYAYHFEEGKVTRDEQGRVAHRPEGIPHGPASHVLQYARTLGGWETPVTELKKRLFSTDEPPQRIITLMASGMAVRSDDPFEILQQQQRKTWALDMEAASLYFALHTKPFVNGLVVKGVVDYADHTKDDRFHDFAARASAIYLLTFIQEYVTTNALLHRRNPPVFTVPYPRNAYFTGREELPTQIHTRSQAGQATAISQPQAMTGPGGIKDRGQYSDAEPLLVQALAIREQRLEETHLDTAASLNNLAEFYWQQGNYEQAEPLYMQALAIREQQFGETHPDTAQSLNNLANLYHEQGKYAEAESLYLRALAIWEQQLRPDHPHAASPLNNMAILYREQGRYAEAEPLYLRVLAIWERQLGPDHPQVAYPLTGLANLYNEQSKYAEAESLYLRALAIWEQQLRPDHPLLAHPLNGLAELYHKQGKYAEAESLYLRALAIWEQQAGPSHPLAAYPLNGLAELYRQQGKYAEAESLYQRALAIWEQRLGETHLERAETLHGLAQLWEEQGNSEEARMWY